MRTVENPAPELFTTFERVDVCHRVEVTEDNLHSLAKFFGWSVDYGGSTPRLRQKNHTPVDLGSWLDQRGSQWNPDPLAQGWSPAGTFIETEPTP